MKKYIFILIGLLFFSLITHAQSSTKRVKWEIKTSKTKIKKGEEVEIILTARIDSIWYMYVYDEKADSTTVHYAEANFIPHASYKLSSKFKPVKPVIKYDYTWALDISFFEKKGEFRQKIKVLAPNPVIKFSVVYQLCSEVTGTCIMYEDTFELTGLVVE